ncbi:hypothetical protein CL614_10475 [archaeon]|jgi:hypothetical protein|nr:hypothetical protein [archaeon]|tara:strand:+ start:309 stop:512 length:204 start_codon:yes stop_codon:yes gene_type:complete
MMLLNMQISIDITTKQEKILKKVYGEQTLDALFQLWFNEWIKKRVDKLMKAREDEQTLNQKIDELTK